MSRYVSAKEREFLSEWAHARRAWRHLPEDTPAATEAQLYTAFKTLDPARMELDRVITYRVFPVKARVAELVLAVLDALCGVTRHAGGCWVMSRWPIGRALMMWACDVTDDALLIAGVPRS